MANEIHDPEGRPDQGRGIALAIAEDGCGAQELGNR